MGQLNPKGGGDGAKLVAVIVTYNGARWIHQCLESVVHSRSNVRIVVVDNESTDQTISIVREDFSGVDLVSAGENLGFGGGNNLGIDKAIREDAVDYLFLLNQDAWVDDETIRVLLAAAEEHPEYGIISPVHYNGDGSLLDKGFLRRLCGNDRKLLTGLFRGEARGLREVRFVNAAAWLVRADCIRKVGLFDPIFFHYGEDGNFIDRCRYFGYKIGLCLDAKIWHDREEREGGAPVDRTYRYERLRTGWVGGLTDPADEEWDRNYSARLFRFVARNSFTSIVHFLAAPITFLRLWFYRGTIARARLRMKEGYPAYAVEER